MDSYTNDTPLLEAAAAKALRLYDMCTEGMLTPTGVQIASMSEWEILAEVYGWDKIPPRRQ